MAGRRWAESKARRGAEAATPRPSERRGAGPAGEGRGKRSKGPDRSPSPEAIRRARDRLQPPPAPWHPLPLAELAIVLGAVAMLASVAVSSDQGLVAGFLLIAAGTAEFSWREHRHGYRSHGALLAGLLALPVALVLWKVLSIGPRVALSIGAVVFLISWSVLGGVFKRARENRLQQHGVSPPASRGGSAGGVPSSGASEGDRPS